MTARRRLRRPHRRSTAGARRATEKNQSMAVYVISVAAELAGVHPQTLRIYERKGLLGPGPDAGREPALQRRRHRTVAPYPGTDSGAGSTWKE